VSIKPKSGNDTVGAIRDRPLNNSLSMFGFLPKTENIAHFFALFIAINFAGG
jgi:hypothetical protein